MKIFQKLAIEGNRENLNQFVNAIKSDLKNWTLWEGYNDWKKSGSISAIPYLALDTPTHNTLQSATVFLFTNSQSA